MHIDRSFDARKARQQWSDRLLTRSSKRRRVPTKFLAAAAAVLLILTAVLIAVWPSGPRKGARVSGTVASSTPQSAGPANEHVLQGMPLEETGKPLPRTTLAQDEIRPPGAIARFRFRGNTEDESQSGSASQFQQTGAQITKDGLYLNGVYYSYHAIAQTPKLNYDAFTVVLGFDAHSFEQGRSNLVTGGRSHRWFGLHRSGAGNLTVTFNNQRFSREIVGAALQPGRPTVVACGVDLPNKKVLVYLDGAKVGEIDLPDHFQLEVVDSDAKERDKVWSFANYSNAQAFHGLVTELTIYNRILSTEELEKIK